MKRILLSSGVIVVFILYTIRLRLLSESSVGKSVTKESDSKVTLITPMPVTQPSSLPTSSAIVTSSPVPTTNSRGRYKDGTYTGIVADAFYGNVQVQVTISGGKITDVQFLQYPNDRQTSIEINSQAMPYLKQEAITAQSANVQGVSGATATSGAFVQSLDSALQQAI